MTEIIDIQKNIELDLHSFASFDKRYKDGGGQYLFRYSLIRRWPGKPGGKLVFIMLNPSTADAFKLDPTVRRCVTWAQEWGYGELEVVNLFSFRSPKPKAMKAAEDPVGPLNDAFIQGACDSAKMVICAWGAHGSFKERSTHVRKLLGIHDLYYLTMNKTGEPAHPLYLKGSLKPSLWRD